MFSGDEEKVEIECDISMLDNVVELYGKDILLKLIKLTDYVDKIDENNMIVDATRYYLKEYKIKIK